MKRGWRWPRYAASTALDFMHAVLYDGRRFRTLNVIGDANRRDAGHRGRDLDPHCQTDPHGQSAHRLLRYAQTHPHVQPEMTSRDFTSGLRPGGVSHWPSEANQNAYIERFNRTYHHEVLRDSSSIPDAQHSNHIHDGVIALLTVYRNFRKEIWRAAGWQSRRLGCRGTIRRQSRIGVRQS